MKILIVEDEKLLADSLRAMLEGKGFTVEAVYDGETGAEYAETGVYDLLILDVMMPGLDGYQVARQVRARRCGTPILMLTARSSLEDRIEGLNAGADYYLTKPFDTRELLARLRALTRRPGTTAESAIRCGDVTLDAAQLTLSGPKAAAALTKREADLLEVLLRTPGQLQTRAVLLARVWGPLAEVEDANLDCYIHFVRRRLKAVGSAVTITTVRGSGYKAEVPPC